MGRMPGFPDVAGKAGTGQLAGKVQGAKGGNLRAGRGGQLSGKLQGAQGGQIANKMQGFNAGSAVAGGAIAGGLANIHGGDLGSRLQGGEAGQLRNNLSPERNQAIANRQQYWNNWSSANQGKLADFRTNRGKDWNNINNFRKNENVAARFNSSQWNNYRNNVNNFRNNRSIEIRNCWNFPGDRCDPKRSLSTSRLRLWC
jgi:hypothetical protein